MNIRLVPLLLLAACATQAPAPTVVQSWESPAAEFPAICMQLRDDGTLAFHGGFEFYNPGKWRREGDRLTLTLGGAQPFPADLSKAQLRGHQGGLTGYDAALRQLSYNIGPGSDAIALGNFYFSRSNACSAR